MTPALSLYQRIAAEMRRDITSGVIKPGDKLPTERQLVERFSVSRDTIRDATAMLINEGLVERVPGRTGGMVVRDRVVVTFHASWAESPGAPVSEADSWITEVRALGLTPTQDFSCRMVTLSSEMAHQLRLTEPGPAVLRRCVRYVNDRPSSIQDTYYPKWLTDLVPDLLSPEDIKIGTTRLLAERGIVQTGYLDTVRARMATPEEAGLLRLGAGTPVLVKTRVACTADRVVRLTVETMAGDGNAIEYEIGGVEPITGAR
ncbi:GntR family transcriptional regulator [Dactylosporangium sp. NPDC005572]|uniref:GntR family transcriptional regulator n=1 Tax=Dactylosporangium sp. NPDC005572 TaxID=3156889 RepID=UPI0033AEED5A